MALTGIIIGITFGVMGILIFLSEYCKAKRCTAEASALIVDVIKDEHWRYRKNRSGYVTYFYPVLEFAAGDKTWRVKTVLKATRPETFQKGERLNILYNPQNPADLKRPENTLWEGVAGMAFMFILGAVFAYIGIKAG